MRALLRVRRMGPVDFRVAGRGTSGLRLEVFVEVAFQVVVTADVAGLLRADLLVLVRLQDLHLHRVPACGMDGMGDGGVEFGPAVEAAESAVFVEPASAL